MKPIIKNGKTLGFYDRDTAVFKKRVDNSKHLFRNRNAYAISKMLFDKLVEKDAKIEITDDEGTKYEGKAKELRSIGITDQIGSNEMQFFIPRHAFRTTYST